MVRVEVKIGLDRVRAQGSGLVPAERDTSVRDTPRNPAQETAISVQFVPRMRFLVFDFGVQ
eukprot:626338-Rhodomonas_salina.1